MRDIVFDEFDSIKVDITHSLKTLDFKLETKKGKPDIYDDYDRKDEEKYYFEAKNLKPFENFPNPYWNIYYLVSKFGFLSSTETYGNRYHKFFLKDSINLYKKFLPLTTFKRLSNSVLIRNWDFYENTIKSKNNQNINFLIISNEVLASSPEEFFYFREKFSPYAKEDNVIILELDKYILEKGRKYLVEDKMELLKKYDNLDYRNIKENICKLENLENLENSIKLKFDLIEINIYLFIFKEIGLEGFYRNLKFAASYLSAQVIFNSLILSFQKLKKSGVFKLRIGELNSKLIFDIISILKYYFKKVYIFKGITHSMMQPYKDVVCNGFKGITEKDLENLKNLSKQWYQIEKECNTDITTFNDKKKYITSILDYSGNLNEIKYFWTLETFRKIDIWKKIIKNYYYIKENGEKAINDLIRKKIYRTMQYYKIRDIDQKISLEKIKKDIILKDNCFNFEQLFSYFTVGEKLLPRMFGDQKKYTPNLEILYETQGRLILSKRTLDSIPSKQYESISFILKEFKFLNNQIKKRYVFRDVSQAFLKMYEILSIFDLFKIKSKIHKTFHLCEAPGQFILATNHYLKTKTKNIDFLWKAQTLNPKITGALKDNYKLIEKYPDRWDFGPDDTGDITKLKNIRYYIEQLQGCDLVTFDCGIGFETKTDEAYQDKTAIKINYSQILIILGGLSLGSNMILKVYLPQSSPYIISLNYILYCCFEQFFMYKSIVNPQSSEIYLIGKKMEKKLTNEQLESLIKQRNKVNSNNFLLKIPEKFLNNYQEIIEKFCQNNINAITRFNYYYFNQELLNDHELFIRVKKDNAKNWLENFEFDKIEKKDML